MPRQIVARRCIREAITSASSGSAPRPHSSPVSTPSARLGVALLVVVEGTLGLPLINPIRDIPQSPKRPSRGI